MKNKKKRKSSIIIMAGILMLSLTACSSTEKPQDAYTKAHESLSEIVGSNELTSMVNEITQLVNYRYSHFDIMGSEYKYISSTTLNDLTSRINSFGDSRYYDVSDNYNEVYKNIEEYITHIGGQIQKDGSIIYPDGIKATVIQSEKIEENINEADTIDTELHQTLKEGLAEEVETIAEKTDFEEVASNKNKAEENVDESEGNEENTGESEENTGKSGETIEYIDDTLEQVYLTGKPPVGTDEEGFPIDEDGNIVIIEGSAGDPRLDKIIDLDGNVLWNGCSEAQALHLTNEENREFMRAQRKVNEDAFSKSIENKEKFEEQQKINEIEASAEDTDDGLGNPENIIVYEDDILTNLYQMETSTSIEYVDGKHIIEWPNILDYYNKQTGRYEYKILDQTFYIDLASTYIPISAYEGHIEYNFTLMDYRLLDNGQLLLFYESKDVLGNLANALTITGKVENGQFIADNITDFTNFYSK